MLKNYLLIALRQIRRNRLHSLINILGLAIGFASTILILLYINDELSYDQFHTASDRIFRISSHSKIGDNERHWSLIPSTVAPEVISTLPGIENQARITTLGKANQVISYKDQVFDESLGTAPYGRVYRVDSTLLDIFTYSMTGLQGSKALAKPNSLVITRQAADRIFKKARPLGKVLDFANLGSYEVTAIIETVPPNSHFQFDYLLSYDFEPANSRSGFFWVRSYLLLDPSADRSAIKERLGEIGRAAEPTLIENGVHMDYFLQNVREIHLSPGLEYELYPTGDRTYIYIFLAVCAFIMAIATINFINLSSAQLSTRSREVGMRKVMGAQRAQMLILFVVHSFTVCLAAFLLALLLIFLSIDYFNAFSDKQLSLEVMLHPLWLIGIIVTLGLISGITALFPSLSISKMSAILAIKDQINPGSRTQWFRKLLVIFQFSISVTLILCTLIIIRQLNFMRSKNPGFATEQVVNILVDGNSSDPKLNTLKQAFRQFSKVESASLATGAPGAQTHVSVMRPEGFDENNTQRLDMIYADFDLIRTFDIQLLSGRDFDEQRPSDSLNFIINRTAAEQFGWSPEEAIGKQMNYLPGRITGKSGKIIGVMDDFHYQSLHHPIRPLFIGIRSTNFNVLGFQYLSLKINLTDLESTLELLRTTWKELIPEKPFNYSFLDATIHNKYDQEERLGQIITTFALLAIGIACLGLLGLASFVVRQKTKEIGIRKVLGASLMQIWSKISISFVLLVAIGNVVAWPLGYYLMEIWLDDFAYQTDVPFWIFLFAGMCSFAITLLTIGWRTLKAALANPIDAIRYE